MQEVVVSLLEKQGEGLTTLDFVADRVHVNRA
jgi:hypothetical protein